MSSRDFQPLPRKTGPKYGSRAFTEGEEDVILWHHTAQNRHVNELAFLCGCSDETIRKAIQRALKRQKPPTPQGQAAAESEDTDHRAKDTPKAVGDGN